MPHLAACVTCSAPVSAIHYFAYISRALQCWEKELDTRPLRGQHSPSRLKMENSVEGFLRLNCQSPDNLNKFTVVELKDYLREGDLNLSGNKNELCEKVFYAYKLGVPKSPGVKDEEKIKKQTSEKKLSVENGLIKLPPPDELKQGWQSGNGNFPDTTELGKLWTCFRCGVPHYKSQLKVLFCSG